MGYYVVGEPIPLPIEKSLSSQEFLAFFPSGPTCIFFKKREKAIRYAQFRNAENKIGICPLFELEAIPENAQIEILKLGEGGELKAKKGYPKKHKAIASATLDYVDNKNPLYNKVKFEKRILKQSFDTALPSHSPHHEILSVPNRVKLPQPRSTITFASILLAAVVSTLLWSVILYYSSLPATFIQMLATWGIIFVLPSSVLMAKIWFAFSLGTLATGALMGFYYGVKYTLKLVDLLISVAIQKCQTYAQNEKAPLIKEAPEKTYLNRLSDYIGQSSQNFTQQISHLKDIQPATFSWKALRQKVGSVFRSEPPQMEESAKKDPLISPH